MSHKRFLCFSGRRPGCAALGIAVLLGAGGCSGEPEPPRAFPKGLGGPGAAAADTAAVAGTSAREPPATLPGNATVPPGADSGWSTAARSGAAGGGVAIQRAVRVGRNEGYDRIVIDVGPDPLPGWRVAYEEGAVQQCGSGDEVAVAGAGRLAIRLEPAQAHDDAGRATVAERELRPGLPSVREVRLVCDFEAQVEWVAGVVARRPFRVLRLREPNRLVIDVRHPD